MGDDLTSFEMRRSKSPAGCMEDYRKKNIAVTNPIAVPESHVPVTGSGSETVQAIAYRPLDQISGLVPAYSTNMTTAPTTGGLPTTVTTTTTGYVNGGQSINFRPRQAEPVDRSSGLGVGDIEFDTKCTDAYANLDDVRDSNYQNHASEAIYKGVPNRSKEQKQKAKISCCFASFVIFIFIFQVIILVLAVFNLVNGLEVGSLTKSLVASSSTTSTPQTSTQDLSDRIRELQGQLDKLERDLTKYNTTHSSNFDSFYTKLVGINQTVSNLSATTSSPKPTETDVSVPLSPISQDCTVHQRECTAQNTAASNNQHPDFMYCATTEIIIENTNDTYLADTVCTVNTGDQVMPIATTLANTTTGYSCLCHGLNIPSAVQLVIRTFKCFFRYTICPTSVQIAVPLQ